MTALKSSVSSPAPRSLEKAVAIDCGGGCAPAAPAACGARLLQHADKHGAYAALVSRRGGRSMARTLAAGSGAAGSHTAQSHAVPRASKGRASG
jgi:hypothetical protein